jgi:deazaflavin-dependent oxidoreductase (nitroreductase family)
MMRTGQAQRISGRERIGLFLHRGLDRWLSPLGVWVFRRSRAASLGLFKVDALLLTTRGRRSPERTVVQYFADGDAMLVAAANDGGRSHPGWHFNLVAAPDARVEVEGQSIPVRADELTGDEAAAAWHRIVERDRNYERYARAAGQRAIPILRLVGPGR